LKDKRRDRIRHLRDTSLSYDKIVNEDFDVAVLTPYSKSHKPLYMASLWHGEPWDIALRKLKEFMKVPAELNQSIYENHFIAKSSLYKQYVEECLTPVMQFMLNHECFFADSNYAKRKTHKEREHYMNTTGRKDWPIAPFILERLFSIWIHNKQLKVINL
jgi:hypothetical protein